MTAHRGAFGNIFGTGGRDPAVTQQDYLRRAQDPDRTALFGVAGDPHRSFQLLSGRVGASEFYFGMVVHSVGHLGWYRVQLGDGQGVLPCCFATASGGNPGGPQEFQAISMRTLVLVYRPKGRGYGIIMAIIPPITADTTVFHPDFMFQGSMTGVRQEKAHAYPIANLADQGGYIDFSCGKPRDLTSKEKGFYTSTGIILSVDDFLLQMRVNEMCGIWMTPIDQFMRIAASHFLVETSVHEEHAGNDEGELFRYRGEAIFPHEALGLLAFGDNIGTDYGSGKNEADRFKQQDSLDLGDWPNAAFDLKDGNQSVLPAYRREEYGGYLGQGGYRSLGVPKRLEGVRKDTDGSYMDGVFAEWVSTAGDYSLLAAKNVIIGRTVNIPLPARVKPVESAEGDDARKGGYKFSGLHGTGPEHVVASVTVPEDNSHVRRVLSVLDLVCHARNWQRLHPFSYHARDFDVPEEGDNPKLSPRQDVLRFDDLQKQCFMRPFSPVKITVDSRYGDVNYYRTEQYIALLEDGGVVIRDGFGSALRMTGGGIRLECAGDIDIAPGRHFRVLANQIVLRGKGSIDVSSSDADIRLKAEKNLQVVAGNGGDGGILLESKATTVVHDYLNKTGEDVVSSGIVLKSATGDIGVIGGNVYVRSGASSSIVLDADKGSGSVFVQGQSIQAFCQTSFDVLFGPNGASDEISKAYALTKSDFIVETNLRVGGDVVMYGTNADFLCRGNLISGKNIIAVGSMSQQTAGSVGATDSEVSNTLSRSMEDLASAVDAFKQAASTAHSALFTGQLYADNRIGNDKVISLMGFSYRDTTSQYQTEDFVWPQRFWEQLVDLGVGRGGTAWVEKSVSYQGQPQYPWPGQAWTSKKCFLKGDLKFYDHATGNAKDRDSGLYHDPQVGEFELDTMSGNYKIIEAGL